MPSCISAPSPMPSVAAAGVRARETLQVGGHGRARLVQHSDQLLGEEHVARREEREGEPTRARTPSAAYAVYVVLRLRGRVVVDDGAHVLDVEAAAGDVGRDEHVGAALLELLQRPVALLLRLVAVDRLADEAAPAQVLVERLAAALLLAEDDHLRAAVVERLQDADGTRVLLVLVAHLEALVDGLGGTQVGGVVDGDHQWVHEEGRGEARHLLWPRGRPHECLALGGVRLLDDGPELRLEAEIEHAICLVEHEEGAPTQVRLRCVHEVEQPSRRGDTDLHSVLQVAQLRALWHAAVDGGVLHPRCLAEAVALAFDLQGELSCWGEHERNRAVSRLEMILCVDVYNRRKSEAEGLPRTCRCEADQIMPAQRDRPGLALDRRRPREATPLKFGRQELRERRLDE
mmetsp:Transcript_37782/g.80467  ORF Transcript_37782/g.80467 Transcript_37782/m.80467 type:complete len:403 (+) Transcript_37782:329-1537(+)